jgi:hypothetical protein
MCKIRADRDAHGTALAARDGSYGVSCAAISPAALRACSACAGEYEDPDRTAWDPELEEEEPEDGSPGTRATEFPAEE